MLTLNISSADLEITKYERFRYPCPIVQKRLHTLFIKSTTNLSHKMIACVVGIHADTVTDYIRFYNEGGLSRIYQVGYGTNTSDLEYHNDTLLDYFKNHPPHTLTQAKTDIYKLTGVDRSLTQIRAWMQRHGFRYRKTGQIPAKADKEKQLEFVNQVIEPLKKRAESGEIHLLFLDAAHFVMGVFLCCLWSVKRVFVKSSSGRKRYNVLGAVNAVTKKIHIWTNNSYINAECICDFLEQLRTHYNDDKPIYIILDNARYQKCQLVKYIAWQFNIRMVYMPPYSPNLNIIERLWKWTKKKVLYAKYYQDFNTFKNAIDKAIIDANYKEQKEIQSLLSLKFQLF